MLNLLTTMIETASRSITYAVDVEFEKDGGAKHEANVTCTLNEDAKIGYENWECLIVNKEELPELTPDEVDEIIEHAKKYARVLGD